MPLCTGVVNVRHERGAVVHGRRGMRHERGAVVHGRCDVHHGRGDGAQRPTSACLPVVPGKVIGLDLIGWAVFCKLQNDAHLDRILEE